MSLFYVFQFVCAMKDKLKRYRDQFTESAFWKGLSKYARRIGVKAVYSALLLFYAYRRKDTPGWAKRIILGALGYLVAPIDAIPDLSPIVGFTDDIGVLSFGLAVIATYVNNDVKQQARKQLAKWFKEYDESDLIEVDKQL